MANAISSIHIDAFFARYTAFAYNPSQPMMQEFRRMSTQLNWNKNKERSMKKRLKDAMVLQFNEYYGTDVDDINAWKAMCVVLAIKPIPDELKACRAAVKATHVNIVDYIEAKRLGIKVKKFRTVKALAEYTIREEKVFPKEHAKAGGVLRYLLKQIFANAYHQ